MIMKLKEGSELAIKLRETGDPKYMEALYNKYFPILTSYMSKSFNNIPSKHHHDICTESFITSFKKIDQFDDKKSAYKTWLFNIAFNNARQYFLRDPEHTRETLIENEAFELLGYNKSLTGNKHKTIVKHTNIYDTEQHPLDISVKVFDLTYEEIEERHNLVQEIIRSLDEERLLRKIAQDYYIENFSMDELYEKYKLPEGTVKSRIKMCKNRIVKKYRAHFPNDIKDRTKELAWKRANARERREMFKKVLEKIDVVQEVCMLDIDEIKKSVFLEYRVHKRDRQEIADMFNLKKVDKVNSYCNQIRNKLLNKFGETI